MARGAPWSLFLSRLWEDPNDQGASRGARKVQPVLLGRPVGRANSCDFGLDRPQGRRARRGREAYARGRRWGGWQRQARGDGEQTLSAARTLWRTTVGDGP